MRRYKFIGDTRHGLGFINGHIYDLQVERPNALTRFMRGHMSWRVVIIFPRFCPYSSEETFKANWQEVQS